MKHRSLLLNLRKLPRAVRLATLVLLLLIVSGLTVAPELLQRHPHLSRTAADLGARTARLKQDLRNRRQELAHIRRYEDAVPKLQSRSLLAPYDRLGVEDMFVALAKQEGIQHVEWQFAPANATLISGAGRQDYRLLTTPVSLSIKAPRAGDIIRLARQAENRLPGHGLITMLRMERVPAGDMLSGRIELDWRMAHVPGVSPLPRERIMP